MRWRVIAALVCCCFSACDLQTNFFNKNKTTDSNHLPYNLNSASLAESFAGKWLIVFEPKRLPNGEANQNEFEIQFDFHQRLGKDYLFMHTTKRPPQLWQTNVRHGIWNIKKVKRNDDGTYSMNLNLYANRNVEQITLVVDKLTRHSFEAYLETNPSLNFQGNRR